MRLRWQAHRWTRPLPSGPRLSDGAIIAQVDARATRLGILQWAKDAQPENAGQKVLDTAARRYATKRAGSTDSLPKRERYSFAGRHGLSTGTVSRIQSIGSAETRRGTQQGRRLTLRSNHQSQMLQTIPAIKLAQINRGGQITSALHCIWNRRSDPLMGCRHHCPKPIRGYQERH